MQDNIFFQKHVTNFPPPTRLVVTTLTFDEETKSLLVFDQVAEKDMKFHMSTRIALEAESSEDGDPSKDILVMTCETSKGVRWVGER